MQPCAPNLPVAPAKPLQPLSFQSARAHTNACECCARTRTAIRVSGPVSRWPMSSLELTPKPPPSEQTHGPRERVAGACTWAHDLLRQKRKAKALGEDGLLGLEPPAPASSEHCFGKAPALTFGPVCRNNRSCTLPCGLGDGLTKATIHQLCRRHCFRNTTERFHAAGRMHATLDNVSNTHRITAGSSLGALISGHTSCSDSLHRSDLTA